MRSKKSSVSQNARILALDLHPRSFGYAVMETGRLIAWGVTKWKSGQFTKAEAKLTTLHKLWQPECLIMRDNAPHDLRKRVLTLAKEVKVQIFILRQSDIVKKFETTKRHSRFDIARKVASRFSQVSPRLPEKRKLGHEEPLALRMFNAIAAGIAACHKI